MFFKIETNLVFSFFKDRDLVVVCMEDYAGFMLLSSNRNYFSKQKIRVKLKYRTRKEQNSTLCIDGKWIGGQQ